ncbi:DUF4303 domain-containing protein [Hydrogenophaga sp.]|jgi:hypothetical protein|uniref:DUF4303 domain-containing protein n=1 Tax=Hydrogenophaga sp. TaxID=1904254 RepID=UPI003F713C95
MKTIDENRLYAALYVETQQAWRHLKNKHQDENFYAFGLYTTDAASYLTITASTEQGLMTVVEDYVASSAKSQESQLLALRWSPCDSPLHEEGDGLLSESQAVRDLGPEPYECTEEESDAAVEAVFRAFTAVIQKLDSEGEFGVGEQREKLILGIWWGDQSDEDRLALACPMNSAAAIERFAREMSAAWRQV